MKRTVAISKRFSGLAALTLSAAGVATTSFAAKPPAVAEITSAQVEHHTSMASDYRARMRSDPKRAIVWFTQANHCDLSAEQLRVAAVRVRESDAAPVL